MFLREDQEADADEAIKQGKFIKLKGITTIDRFDGELRSLGALGDGESIFVRQPGNGPSSPDGDDGVSDS